MNISRYKRVILEVLNDNPVHPSANELYHLVKEKYPDIGIATIYRNLDSLVAGGQIIRFNTGAQYDRYDGTIDEHYHMLCNYCGKVYDIPAEYINLLEDKVDEITGHKITEYKLILKGNCKTCINDNNIIDK